MSSGPPRKRILQIAGQSSLLAFQSVRRKMEETGIVITLVSVVGSVGLIMSSYSLFTLIVGILQKRV